MLTNNIVSFEQPGQGVLKFQIITAPYHFLLNNHQNLDPSYTMHQGFETVLKGNNPILQQNYKRLILEVIKERENHAELLF